MTGLVVDASVAIKWTVNEPDTPQALQLIAYGNLIAPELLLAEFANVLATKIRRGEFKFESIDRAIEVLHATRLRFRPLEPLIEAALRLSHRLQHPAYDCFYLALALSEGSLYVTADAKFLRKLDDAGHDDLGRACISLADAASGLASRQ